ncbi:MAG: hypothetical protein E3J72_05985 [Planctomycetota bacterium]|nr:MAG: hypothetical protein E3J72_05985 [Planctomycetota bacterium]
MAFFEKKSRQRIAFIIAAVIVLALAGAVKWISFKEKVKGDDLTGLSVIWPESFITAEISIKKGDGPAQVYKEEMYVRPFRMGTVGKLREVFRETLTTAVRDCGSITATGADKLPPGPSYILKRYDRRWRNRVRFAGKADVFDLVRAATGDSCVLPPRPVRPDEMWHEKIGYGDFMGDYTYTYLGRTSTGAVQIRCTGFYRDLEQNREIGSISVTTTLTAKNDVSENRIEGVFNFHPPGMTYTERFVEKGVEVYEFPKAGGTLPGEIKLLEDAITFFRQKNLESAGEILDNYLKRYPGGHFTRGVRLLREKVRRASGR